MTSWDRASQIGGLIRTGRGSFVQGGKRPPVRIQLYLEPVPPFGGCNSMDSLIVCVRIRISWCPVTRRLAAEITEIAKRLAGSR